MKVICLTYRLVFRLQRNLTRSIGWEQMMGRDVFTRIFYGYRISLSFSLILVFLEILIGTIIGGLQGYFAGIFDLTFQKNYQIFSAIPFFIPSILIMGSFFGRSFTVLYPNPMEPLVGLELVIICVRRVLSSQAGTVCRSSESIWCSFLHYYF